MFSEFMTFLKNDGPPPAQPIDARDFTHAPPSLAKAEMTDIERSYARLFSSADGQRVLAHLQVMTFHRALGPTCSDEQLRHMEGQRALVATILRLIDRGRQ